MCAQEYIYRGSAILLAYDPRISTAPQWRWTLLLLLAHAANFGEHMPDMMEQRMDQMAALAHLRALIKAAQGSDDVEVLQRKLREMLVFIEKSLGRKG